jgi:hypothetical protein
MPNVLLRNKLVNLLNNLSADKHKKLEEMKDTSEELNRHDIVWHLLLCSMSTMGNSRGYEGLIENRDNYNQVSYESLSKHSAEQRYKILQDTLKTAKVRMPLQKALWLNENFEIIEKIGGIKKTKELAFAQKGTEAKIEFMKQFHGIGPKYARNIWMDIYHPDFYNNIAIDERIKKITEILDYNFDNYSDHEKFYLDIAKEAKLQGWELDRLLYQFNGEFIEKLLKEKNSPK